ncbi:MAG: excisionase family DNA-binding protein [Actinomycetes bacterium]
MIVNSRYIPYQGLNMLPDPESQPTMTVDEAGELLNLSRSSIYAAVRSGEVPSIRIGRRDLVLTAPLLKMLQAE